MMQQRNYYYLVSGLPDIVLEQSKAPFTLPELLEAFRASLHPDDLQLIALILLPADNRNLLNVLQKKNLPWEAHGNFSHEEIEEGLKEPGLLPAYFDLFQQAFKADMPLWPGMSWENQLARLYYGYVLERTEGFLHEWFTFENYLKNILAAWNIREYQLAPEGQLVGENMVTEAAAHAHARDLGLSGELPFVNRLMHALEQDKLLEREKAISRIQWNYIDELNTFNYFSTEVILGYLLKLIILSRWTQLDPERGTQAINAMVKELEDSFELPKKFALA